MSVEFNEEQSIHQPVSSSGFFHRLIIGSGIATTEREANTILVTGAGALVLAAVAIPFFFGPKDTAPTPEVMDAAMPARIR
ncbi:MAG: hypothetical protein KA104_01935 [Candidatus Pacebacteria bacterium]|jgi:hypothetical protein|nr:hypothetical protein [Candidatus Paceibacterota bacterium]